ncbi:FK506-binding protein 59 isoform X2 [Copidosoma floridanum]|nr:FK506-binding protein 59 isoform X2 [Copidosoma floridanum]
MAVDITREKDGGVLKEIIKEGTGDDTPGVGSFVKVHYTGTLLDGTKFDSSKDRNDPFEFDLGMSQVIKAWDVGVRTMKKGEVAILTCAPEYAYGAVGSPPKIPPNATLKFEIEMIDWIGEDITPEKDKGVTRDQIKEGEGFLTPSSGGLVDVHITGTYNGRVFDDRDVKFTMGEGEAENIVSGIEIALEKFKKGEISILKIKSKYAFGKTGSEAFNIPPNADIEYKVELKNLEKGLDVWSLDEPQKVEQAKMFKDKGTNYFKDNKINLAIKMYQKAIEYINTDYGYNDELLKVRNSLLLSCNLNLALCFLKNKSPFEAKEAATKALEVDPKNEKALFRRGQALLDLALAELAVKDFEEVLKIEPKNTAAAKQALVCKNMIKKDLAKEKKLYANMFEKFAKEDQQ